MRVRTFLLLIASLAGLVTMAPAAHADDSTTSTTATDLKQADSVGTGDGFYFTGAVVTPPDGGEPRTMNAYQAAVFVQSWLPTIFFSDEATVASDPPADLPVSKVVISGTWGSNMPTGTMTVYFATNGTTSWVAFPEDQPIATDPGTPSPDPSNWFTPPARVLEAFNGTADLVETTGTQMANGTTTVPGEEAAGASSGDDSSVPVWVWAAVAAVGAAVLVGFVLRRRRAAPG